VAIRRDNGWKWGQPVPIYPMRHERFGATVIVPNGLHWPDGLHWKGTSMNKIALSLAAAVAVAATLPAFAQAPKAPTPAQPAATAAAAKIPTGVFYRGQGPTQYLAKTRLIGAKVLNKDGIVIGDIEDLIIGTDNKIDGVIMGVGGFLGAGEKKIGVRYEALKIERKDGKQTVSLPQATKEVLAALEPYMNTEARKTMVERAKEKAKELSDKVKDGGALDKAKEVGKSAVDKTKELGTKAVEKGKEVIDGAKEKAKAQ
jgi:sporulation protein YlmC with PRC-barrel domain